MFKSNIQVSNFNRDNSYALSAVFDGYFFTSYSDTESSVQNAYVSTTEQSVVFRSRILPKKTAFCFVDQSKVTAK